MKDDTFWIYIRAFHMKIFHSKEYSMKLQKMIRNYGNDSTDDYFSGGPVYENVYQAEMGGDKWKITEQRRRRLSSIS